MDKGKRSRDEYPKLNENDKRWKEQDEFDSAGVQRQSEDEDTNASIAQSPDSSVNKEQEKNRDYSAKAEENTRRDREEP